MLAIGPCQPTLMSNDRMPSRASFAPTEWADPKLTVVLVAHEPVLMRAGQCPQAEQYYQQSAGHAYAAFT